MGVVSGAKVRPVAICSLSSKSPPWAPGGWRKDKIRVAISKRYDIRGGGEILKSTTAANRQGEKHRCFYTEVMSVGIDREISEAGVYDEMITGSAG